MSHRLKNKHKSRHRTHPIKAQSLRQYAPGMKLLAIRAPAAPAAEAETAIEHQKVPS